MAGGTPLGTLSVGMGSPFSIPAADAVSENPSEESEKDPVSSGAGTSKAEDSKSEEPEETSTSSQDSETEKASENASGAAVVETGKEPSPGYKLATFFKKDGFLPGDLEVPEDIDADGLKELVKKTLSSTVEQPSEEVIAAREAEIEELYKQEGLSDAEIEAFKYWRRGLSPETVVTHAQYHELADYEPENNEEKLAIIAEAYKLHNQPDVVDRLLDGLQDEDEIDSELFKSRKILKKHGDELLDTAKKQFEEQLEQQRKQDAKIRKDILSAVKATSFPVQLSEDAAEDLADYVSKKDQVIVLPNNKRVQVARIYSDMEKIAEDPDKLALVAYIVKEGVQAFANTVVENAGTDFIKTLAETEEVSPKKTVASKNNDKEDTSETLLDFFKSKGKPLGVV